MTNKVIRLGSRGSRLALCQAEMIAQRLRETDVTVELTIIESTGDRIMDSPLWQFGGKGVFTKELEQALLDGRIDLAVHSLKDLPTEDAPGLRIAAIPLRDSHRDLLISNGPIEWNGSNIIGTSSLRRKAQLRMLYPQEDVRDIRGNVPTRLKKLRDGLYTAIVLAEAGLQRLALTPPHVIAFRTEEMLPAPGQGALALQIREDDEEITALLKPIHDPVTAACVTAERKLLSALGGGCQAPLGALALIEKEQMRLRGRVVSPDFSQVAEIDVWGSPLRPEEIGAKGAEQLLANGAGSWVSQWTESASLEDAERIVQEVTAEYASRPLADQRVIVTRDEDSDGELSRALRSAGAAPVCLPLLETIFPFREDFKRLCGEIRRFDWVLATSARAIEALHRYGLESQGLKYGGVKFACVGPATAHALDFYFHHSAEMLSRETNRTDLFRLLAEKQRANPPETIFYPHSSLSELSELDVLTQAGYEIETAVAYETRETDRHAAALQQLIRRGECHALTVCSPSAARALDSILEEALAETLVIASIGPRTTAALKEVGIKPQVEAADHTFEGLVKALAGN